MAKWGEGDPRWIVEERADATNVNNWHWTEKNASQWSIDTIKKLFATFHAEDDEFICKGLDVTKCEGEAHANNRKGKLIFFYEWQIEATWSGERKSGDNKTHFTGKVDIPNLSEEYAVHELDISVSCTSTTADGNAIKKFMQTTGIAEIRRKIEEYLQKLKVEYSSNLILPTKSNTKPSATAAVPAAGRSVVEGMKQSDPGLVNTQTKDLSAKEICITEEFFCSPDDLYKVLTIKEFVQAFTRNEAIVEATPNGQYVIFGGNVTGTFIALVPPKEIKMQWRKREWPEGHKTDLSLELAAVDGHTKLTLVQKGVPAYDLENTTDGWRCNFFAAIKQTYGYGGRWF